MGVKLKSRHLWISEEIAASAFGDAPQVYVVYYPQQKSLLLASMHDTLFTSMHQHGGLQMLKTRNLQGDKTISLQEIMIDNDIEDSDRELPYLHQADLQMLHVTL